MQHLPLGQEQLCWGPLEQAHTQVSSSINLESEIGEDLGLDGFFVCVLTGATSGSASCRVPLALALVDTATVAK